MTDHEFPNTIHLTRGGDGNLHVVDDTDIDANLGVVAEYAFTNHGNVSLSRQFVPLEPDVNGDTPEAAQ